MHDDCYHVAPPGASAQQPVPEWTEWTECSASCGIALRTRQCLGTRIACVFFINLTFQVVSLVLVLQLSLAKFPNVQLGLFGAPGHYVQQHVVLERFKGTECVKPAVTAKVPALWVFPSWKGQNCLPTWSANSLSLNHLRNQPVGGLYVASFWKAN